MVRPDHFPKSSGSLRCGMSNKPVLAGCAPRAVAVEKRSAACWVWTPTSPAVLDRSDDVRRSSSDACRSIIPVSYGAATKEATGVRGAHSKNCYCHIKTSHKQQLESRGREYPIRLLQTISALRSRSAQSRVVRSSCVRAVLRAVRARFRRALAGCTHQKLRTCYSDEVMSFRSGLSLQKQLS